MKKNRFKYHAGFTILEMLITISIFSIIVSMTYTILTNFNQELFVYRKIQDQRNIQYLNRMMLFTDFENARVIKSLEGEIVFSSNGHEAVYRIDDGVLYRKVNENEILIEGLNDVEFISYFNGEELFIDGVADQIEIQYQFEGRKFSHSLYKKYGSSVYLNSKY